MSAAPQIAQMQELVVIDSQSQERIGSSAPLYAPLSALIVFQVRAPLTACTVRVAVEFIADVAAEQPPVVLVPFSVVAAAASKADCSVTATAVVGAAVPNTVTLSPSVSSSIPAEAPDANTAGVSRLLDPNVKYTLTLTLHNLSALRAIPLKHLLQVSMMRVRLVAVDAASVEMENSAADGREVAAWNVVWHVRRDPQRDHELVRTVLDPLV
jgi:hypothetical protein